MRKLRLNNAVVGWTSMAVGVVIATTPAWAHTTPVAAGFTLGLGAMTLMYGGWSLIARDPTRDHWALSVVGLVLAIAPWIGGYAGDAAAWSSWIGGLSLMVLAGAAYIADEADAVTATERIKALAKYQCATRRSFQRNPGAVNPSRCQLKSAARICRRPAHPPSARRRLLTAPCDLPTAMPPEHDGLPVMPFD